MAFPYIFSDAFDTGDFSRWDVVESDTGSKLDVPHYATLAAIPGAPVPYRGAYCMRVDLTTGDANDHTVGDGDMNIADGSTAWVRFALFISTSFAATTDDTFNIFEFQQDGGTVEASVGLRITASTDLMEIGVGDGAAPTSFASISKGAWHVIEVRMLVSTSDVGTLTLFVDGAQHVALTGLDHAAAVGAGVLGTQDQLSTTTGLIYFDEFAFDDTRLAVTRRFDLSRLIANPACLFVGAGEVDQVHILDGGSGDVTLELYDADQYTSSMTPLWRYRATTANAPVDPHNDSHVRFSKGCYAVLGGTLPGAVVQIGKAAGWGSDGAIRTHAAKRLAHAL